MSINTSKTIETKNSNLENLEKNVIKNLTNPENDPTKLVNNIENQIYAQEIKTEVNNLIVDFISKEQITSQDKQDFMEKIYLSDNDFFVPYLDYILNGLKLWLNDFNSDNVADTGLSYNQIVMFRNKMNSEVTENVAQK